MNVRLPLLLLAACFCLAGLVLTYMQIERAERHRKRLALRLDQTLQQIPGRVRGRTASRGSELTPDLMRLAAPPPRRTPAARIAVLLGADPARRELYPVPWWTVPLIAAVPARLATMLLEFLIGPSALLATPVLGWLICRRFFATCHQRRVTILFQQLPDALAMIVRAVRVGIPVTEAVRAVAREAPAPTAGEFARLADEIAIGAPLDQALRSMAERNKVAEYRFFATALSLQSQTGGGISETLENLADVIRKRVAARARGHALAAEARTSALALGVLPLLAMAALWVMNPGYIAILFVTKPGHSILAAGTLLLGAGVLAMRFIIQKSLS